MRSARHYLQPDLRPSATRTTGESDRLAAVVGDDQFRVTPDMAAGVADRLWSMEDVAEMVEAGLLKPGERGPYKKVVAA